MQATDIMLTRVKWNSALSLEEFAQTLTHPAVGNTQQCASLRTVCRLWADAYLMLVKDKAPSLHGIPLAVFEEASTKATIVSLPSLHAPHFKILAEREMVLPLKTEVVQLASVFQEYCNINVMKTESLVAIYDQSSHMILIYDVSTGACTGATKLELKTGDSSKSRDDAKFTLMIGTSLYYANQYGLYIVDFAKKDDNNEQQECIYSFCEDFSDDEFVSAFRQFYKDHWSHLNAGYLPQEVTDRAKSDYTFNGTIKKNIIGIGNIYNQLCIALELEVQEPEYSSIDNQYSLFCVILFQTDNNGKAISSSRTIVMLRNKPTFICSNQSTLLVMSNSTYCGVEDLKPNETRTKIRYKKYQLPWIYRTPHISPLPNGFILWDRKISQHGFCLLIHNSKCFAVPLPPSRTLIDIATCGNTVLMVLVKTSASWKDGDLMVYKWCKKKICLTLVYSRRLQRPCVFLCGTSFKSCSVAPLQ